MHRVRHAHCIWCGNGSEVRAAQMRCCDSYLSGVAVHRISGVSPAARVSNARSVLLRYSEHDCLARLRWVVRMVGQYDHAKTLSAGVQELDVWATNALSAVGVTNFTLDGLLDQLPSGPGAESHMSVHTETGSGSVDTLDSHAFPSGTLGRGSTSLTGAKFTRYGHCCCPTN